MKKTRSRRHSKVVADARYPLKNYSHTKLTKVLVDAVLDMRESHGVSYRKLQLFLFEFHGVAVSIRTIRGITNYQRWISRDVAFGGVGNGRCGQ